MIHSISPSWPAPANIRAFTTTRHGGISSSPYDSLNLGLHVNDDSQKVLHNRQYVYLAEKVPAEPFWLNQTHSTNVIDISQQKYNQSSDQAIINTDGSYTCHANKVSVVLTADCLPVLFCSSAGNEVAATHAGWRGLCNGILENTVDFFRCPATEILVWLGPAIGPQRFEVGLEVKQQFEIQDPNANFAFQLIDYTKQKYLANLYLLAKQRLIKRGITQIYGGEYCTYSQNNLFYSYRRDKQTGRMASMIWFE